MHVHQELDTSGLNCPLPILKTKKALSSMQSGEILRVRSTDPVRAEISRPLPSKRGMCFSRIRRVVKSLSLSCKENEPQAWTSNRSLERIQIRFEVLSHLGVFQGQLHGGLKKA